MTTMLESPKAQVTSDEEEDHLTSSDRPDERRTDELRRDMYRSLFGDVRPGWDQYLERTPTARRLHPAHAGTAAELLGGVFRAMFDDVRPRWEAYYAKKSSKLAA